MQGAYAKGGKMAIVRVVLRHAGNDNPAMEEFADAKARIVNGVLQVYRGQGTDEEIIAEFLDDAYLYWRYFD
jgi:hypothetical protein